MVENEGEGAWPEIVKRYDEYSLYEFLRHKGFSEGAIEFYAVMNFVESDLHNSFIEVLREELGGAYVDMQTIVGGMDALPIALYRQMPEAVRFGTEVRAMEQDGSSVTVHCRVGPDRVTFNGDYAICTVPFSVLRPIEADFSREKERAIRQLNYHASTKILLQVRERFWEEEDGIVGGASVTDLPVRRLNYPPSDDSMSRGVLLASYTWGQDALQWGAMDEETRLEEALDDVARIHPRIREVFEVGASHAWYGDRWARGAFALFAPSSRRRSRRRSSSRKAGSTSPASTARSITPGSRERSSRASAPRARSTSCRRRDRDPGPGLVAVARASGRVEAFTSWLTAFGDALGTRGCGGVGGHVHRWRDVRTRPVR